MSEVPLPVSSTYRTIQMDQSGMTNQPIKSTGQQALNSSYMRSTRNTGIKS